MVDFPKYFWEWLDHRAQNFREVANHPLKVFGVFQTILKSHEGPATPINLERVVIHLLKA